MQQDLVCWKPANNWLLMRCFTSPCLWHITLYHHQLHQSQNSRQVLPHPFELKNKLKSTWESFPPIFQGQQKDPNKRLKKPPTESIPNLFLPRHLSKRIISPPSSYWGERLLSVQTSTAKPFPSRWFTCPIFVEQFSHSVKLHASPVAKKNPSRCHFIGEILAWWMFRIWVATSEKNPLLCFMHFHYCI